MLFRIFKPLVIFLILTSRSNNKEIKYIIKNDAFQIYKEGLEAFNINDFFR